MRQCVILTAYKNGPGCSLPFERLLDCEAIQSDLARAPWVLLETVDVGIAFDAVKQIGAEYAVLPYENRLRRG